MDLMMKALGIDELTDESAKLLVELVVRELDAIGNGERGERLEHDLTRAGTSYRAAARWVR